MRPLQTTSVWYSTFVSPVLCKCMSWTHAEQRLVKSPLNWQRTKALSGQQHLDGERNCTNDWHFVSLVCELYGTERYWNTAGFNLMLLLQAQHCLRIICMLSLNLYFIHHTWNCFHEQKQQVNTYCIVVIAITNPDSAASTATGCGQHHQHEFTGPRDHPASHQ